MGGLSMKHRTGSKLAFLYLMLLAALSVLLLSDIYCWYARPSSSWLHSGYVAVRDICQPLAGRLRNTATNPDAPPSDMSKF